jgi:hypothetical protein
MANALLQTGTPWRTLPNPGAGWDQEGGGGSAAPWIDMALLRRLGYGGPEYSGGGGDSSNDADSLVNPAIQAWMDQSGYAPATNPTFNGGHIQQWVDRDGNPVADTQWEKEAPNDNTFWNAALAAGVLVGGAAGGYWGGAEGAVAPAASSGGGGVGTLGTIAHGSAPLAPIGATGAGTVGTNAIMGGLGELATVGGGLGSVSSAGSGASTVGSGAWNGTNFTGSGGGLLESLGSANTCANLAQAVIGLYGQSQALKAAQNATNQSNEFNQRAFDTIRADNKPLMDLRDSVLPQIQGLLKNPGSITSDPGYQFQFGEGQKALNNGAAARGMTYSGAQGKALQRYGNDFASTKLDQSLNRLTNVAGLGQVGANSNNQATQQFANNSSDNALSMGSARGSVYGNMANIGGNALSRVFNPAQYDQLNRRGP